LMKDGKKQNEHLLKTLITKKTSLRHYATIRTQIQ
jgi:hypothetical protein